MKILNPAAAVSFLARYCWGRAVLILSPPGRVVVSAEGRGAVLEGPASCVETAAAVVAHQGDGRIAVARLPADDMRISVHECGHALAAAVLNSPLGGVSVDPERCGGFSGLCWGSQYESRFAGDDDAPTLCEKLGPLMPGPGEDRSAVADVHLHVRTRVTELVAGSVAEALFVPGEPWNAADDRRQERALAGLICAGEQSAEAYISACIAEAEALLRPLGHVVRALASELLRRRTMTGDQVNEVIAAAVSARSMEEERARRQDWRQRQEAARAFTERWGCRDAPASP
jgi:hypothetical protein